MASGNIEKRGDQCYRLRITRIDPLTKKRIVYRETLHCPLKEAQRVLRERLAEIEQTGNVVRTPVTTLEQLEQHMSDNPAGVGLAISAILGKRARLERLEKTSGSPRKPKCKELIWALKDLIAETGEWNGNAQSLFKALFERMAKPPHPLTITVKMEELKQELNGQGVAFARSRTKNCRSIRVFRSE